jgi:hypothetical protein
METRQEVLSSGATEKFATVAISGIVHDELKHKKKLEYEGIEIVTSNYEIKSVEYCEIETGVFVEEVICYSLEENEFIETINHDLVLIYINDDLIVAADKYIENASNFSSASFVPRDTTGMTTRSTSQSNNLVPTIVQVAQTQVGYMEKASNSNLESFTGNAGTANYTKYGAWYGINPGKWCAMFVSWCAHEVDAQERMFERYSLCATGIANFQSQNRFYLSPNRGGTYIPQPGDIYFKEANGDKHTGIVASVRRDGENVYITVIDGNCGARVNQHELNINDTRLVGFAPSCVHSVSQKADTSEHWSECIVCQSQLTEKETHTSVFKYNSTHHWKECSECGTILLPKMAHVFNALGKCTGCGARQLIIASTGKMELR